MKKVLVWRIVLLVIGLGLGFGANAQFADVVVSGDIDHRHLAENLMGGGVTLFDVNNDGLLDIYTTGGTAVDKLYLNEGNSRFTDISDNSNISSITQDYLTFGVVAGDINNDGCKDLFVTAFDENQHNLLLLSNCDNTFENISIAAGITHEATSTSATFLDYNKDGFLDIYVINYIEVPGALFDEDGKIIGFDHKCFENWMYINNGDNTFTEAAKNYGLNDVGCGLAVVGTDFDQDGDQDIYVANDFGEWVTPNVLYRNNFPDDSFTNVSEETGMNIALYGMGIAIGDYDRDTDLDYYVTNLGKNYFMQNQGDNTFVDVSGQLGVENTNGIDGNLTTGWGTFFFDYNNDTYLDLFVSNGFIPAAAFIATTINDENVLYSNSDFNFEDIAPEYGVNSQNVNRGVAHGDFDNDGDSDMFLPSLAKRETEETAVNFLFYENQGNIQNNWSQVKLEGVESNRDAFGSLVHLYSNEIDFVQELYSGGTHASQNMDILNFGLSNFEKIDSIKIVWPSGLVQLYGEVPINETLFLKEGSSEVEIIGCTESSSPNFNPAATKSRACYKKETFGCMDATALNYNDKVTIDDGSCTYRQITAIYGSDINELDVKLAPVPCLDNLKIELSERLYGMVLDIALLNMDGKEVAAYQTEGKSMFTLQTGSLNRGIYLLKVSSKGQQLYSRRIAKI